MNTWQILAVKSLQPLRPWKLRQHWGLLGSLNGVSCSCAQMFSLIVMSQIPELLKELPKTVSARCERRCFAGIIAFWLLPMQLGTGNGHGRFIQDDVVVSEWWFQGIRFDRGTSFARKTPSRFNGILQFRKENFRNTGFVFFEFRTGWIGSFGVLCFGLHFFRNASAAECRCEPRKI